MSGRRRWEKFGKERNSSSSEDNDLSPPSSPYGSIRYSTKEKLNYDGIEKCENSETRRKSSKPQTLSSGQSTNRLTAVKLPSLPKDNMEASSIIEEATNEPACIGPALPPHLMKKTVQLQSRDDPGSKKVIVHPIGPVLPPHLVDQSNLYRHSSTCVTRENDGDELIVGPLLPPHLLQKMFRHQEQSNPCELDPPTNTTMASENELIVGPVLPPGFLRKDENPLTPMVLGPALPPHLIILDESAGPSTAGPNKKSTILGPQLPPGFRQPIDSEESSEEEGGIGPDLRLMSTEGAQVETDVDKRALKAKRKMLGLDDSKIVERESWMLDLPPERAANLGLGPRQFRAKLAPEMGDRTGWTDTPADVERKKQLPPKLDEKDIMKKELIAQRDKEMDRMARKAEKKLKRKEALLVTHQKELKKKAKKEEKAGQPMERKRFNREEDMQVNRFDEAQKKAIYKKAQMLNDRFSSGESKYL